MSLAEKMQTTSSNDKAIAHSLLKGKSFKKIMNMIDPNRCVWRQIVMLDSKACTWWGFSWSRMISHRKGLERYDSSLRRPYQQLLDLQERNNWHARYSRGTRERRRFMGLFCEFMTNEERGIPRPVEAECFIWMFVDPPFTLRNYENLGPTEQGLYTIGPFRKTRRHSNTFTTRMATF